MGSEIRCECIDDAREFLPCSLHTFNEGLSPKFPGIVNFASGAESNANGSDDIPFRSDFEGDASDFLSELAEFVDHGVDYVLELDHDGALYGNGDLLCKVAICDGLANARDVLDLGF